MQSHYYTGGANRFVRELVAQGSHQIEAWGNSREGFTPYLVCTRAAGFGVSIGERYRTLKGLRADVSKYYGPNVKVKQGRNW
jgi:hypothetical protein